MGYKIITSKMGVGSWFRGTKGMVHGSGYVNFIENTESGTFCVEYAPV